MRRLDRSLRELAAGLRAREFSAMDLWHEARAAMDAREPKLGAYKLRMDATAEQAARNADEALRAGRDLGVLQGIPVSVKDLYGIPGFPTYAGSACELPARWQAAGPMVRCLLEEHAVMTGKTHTVEFAFGGVGLNNNWPTPRNPWDEKQHRVPGGSSSGAGVSLREGSAVIALGSDTAGSVRLPASVTGNVGYKPTIGRWSTEGIVPLSPYFDTPGILARTVDDAYLAAIEFDRRMFKEPNGAIEGSEPLEALTIGVPGGHFWEGCEPSIEQAVRSALARLEEEGHQLVPFDWVEAAEAFALWSAGGTVGAELHAFLTSELPDWIPLLDPNVGRRMQAAALPPAEVRSRKAAFDALATRTRRHFQKMDVIATPTVPVPAPTLAQVADHDGYRAHNLGMLRCTHTANVLGLCGMTIPVGFDTLGLPVGLQVMAAPMCDDLLFGAALAIERALGTSASRAPSQTAEA